MLSKFSLYTVALCLGASLTFSTMTQASPFTELRDKYVASVAPLEKVANEAWWESATTGKEEAYAQRNNANEAIAKLHQDKEMFRLIKELRQSGQVTDPAEKRQLDIMYFSYLPYQVDPEITKKIIVLESEVDKIFNTHRSSVKGKTLTENDVRKVLSESNDSKEARLAWEGYMAVGQKVAEPLKELVKLRNQMAQGMGYRDFFAMQLDIQEFKEDELFNMFDELDRLTIAPFKELKSEIDAYERKRFGLKDSDPVRPWHLGDLFFQEAPELKDAKGLNLDDLYKDKDPVKLSRRYYKSIGFDPDSIISKSDLYEKPGKSPHAFATCIDRKQDIRVLCNVKPNGAWMDTVNHELGHGVYDKYIDQNLPFLLRTACHILTTEGYALLEGEMTRTPDFLHKVVGLEGKELEDYSQASWKLLRIERLVFSRWVQTMLHFEKEMYANPDQDLNKLWWSLKKKYQLQDPPVNMAGQDYGAKMHIVGAPVYYHNYMLGDLFAAQVYTYLTKEILHEESPLNTSLYGRPEAGAYLQNEVFSSGTRYNWQDLTKRATGEKLSPKAFANLFLK
ncbi:M2 family metallopeptidase [bacterium]|nr:M2 family metallopeptidase [bacterium]